MAGYYKAKVYCSNCNHFIMESDTVSSLDMILTPYELDKPIKREQVETYNGPVVCQRCGSNQTEVHLEGPKPHAQI